MTLYKIEEENGTRVYKKTFLGNIAIVIICVFLLCSGVFCGTTFYYRSKYTRLMERNRVELELSRQRAAALIDTITRATEEVGGIRESLSRQRTSTAELRALISEVRKRFETMENLLNSIRNDNGDVGNNDSSNIDSTDEK